MNKHVISILVENHAGVLSRVTGLFSRRSYNIDSLSVGITENPSFSRITIVAMGDDNVIDQIKKQVMKLVDVKKVSALDPEYSVFRELALVKVAASSANRPEIIGLVNVFRANVIDVSGETLTIEITGEKSKISAFLELLEPYGVLELARTGLTALERGSKKITD